MGWFHREVTEGDMPAPQALFDLYLTLAEVSNEQHRPQQRERFLALALAAASEAGDAASANACRQAILDANHGHTIRRYGDAHEALQATEFVEYIQALRRLYPFEKAEFLLQKFRRQEAAGKRRRPQSTEVQPALQSPSAPPRRRKTDRIGIDPRSALALRAGLEWLNEFARPPRGYVSPATCWLLIAAAFVGGAVFAMLCALIVR
jgi:hypothetical protein